MLETLRKRHEDEDEGFTLIELMVVVLIIAILLAIAIPTFLGAQDRARDRGAQSDLRNALTAAKTIATDLKGDVGKVTVASLIEAEGAISFTAGTTATEDVVSVSANATTGTLILNTKSASGKVFSIYADKTGAVGRCKAATCSAGVKDW